MEDIMGKAAEAGHEDARIFISLPASFPTQWVLLIHGRAMDLGLSAYVYHGIPQSPFQQTNNAEYEARADMYSAKFVFAALAVKDATEFDGIWIVKHIPKLKTLKIKFDLALVGGDASDFDRGHTTIGVPFDTKISRFPTAEQWLASFSDEIRQYATNLSQKSA
jgi:hypothetical protein